MKAFTNIAGIILIIIGIVALAYQGITYSTREKVADVKLGDVAQFQVTEEKEKVIPFPPLLGGLSLVVGVVLVVASRMGRK